MAKSIEVHGHLLSGDVDNDVPCLVRHDDVAKHVWDAMCNGDLDFVKTMADELMKEPLHESFIQGPRRCTLMHIAVVKNDAKFVRMLSGFKDLINMPDEHGDTPMHYACAGNFVDALDALLEVGADPCGGTRAAIPPLHIAIMSDHFECAQKIMDKDPTGDVIKQTDFQGATTLHKAMLKDDVPLIKAIIERTPDHMVRDSRGRTPVFYATFGCMSLPTWEEINEVFQVPLDEPLSAHTRDKQDLYTVRTRLNGTVHQVMAFTKFPWRELISSEPAAPPAPPPAAPPAAEPATKPKPKMRVKVPVARTTTAVRETSALPGGSGNAHTVENFADAMASLLVAQEEHETRVREAAERHRKVEAERTRARRSAKAEERRRAKWEEEARREADELMQRVEEEARRAEEVARRAEARQRAIDEAIEQRRKEIEEEEERRWQEEWDRAQRIVDERRIQEKRLRDDVVCILHTSRPKPEAAEERVASHRMVGECVVCMEDVDVSDMMVVVPCGHRVMCAACASQCTECPMCRGQVTMTIRVYDE